jgi:hypothetical protein
MTIPLTYTPLIQANNVTYKQLFESFPTAIVTDFAQKGPYINFKLVYALDAPAFTCCINMETQGDMAIALFINNRQYLWAIAIDLMERSWPELYLEAGLRP